jgi:thiamine transport system permease protein
VTLPRRSWLAIGALGFLSVFFLWPLAQVLQRGLAAPATGRLSPGALLEVLARPEIRPVLTFTVWQAVVSTLLTLAVALPAAGLLATLEFRGRRAVEAALLVPFVLPTVVVGAAFTAVLGHLAPVVDLRRSITAILLAHVFFNVAVVVRTVGGVWSHLDPRPMLAARTLGADRRQAFLQVTLPRLRPAIAAATAIVFLFTFTSFGVVLILGPAGAATIEVEIHRAATRLLDLRTAAALSVVQLTAVVAMLAAYGRTRRQGGRLTQRPEAATRRRVTTTSDRLRLMTLLMTLGLLLGAPLLALLERSLRVGEGLGLAHYRGLAGSSRATVMSVVPAVAVRNSLLIALAATGLALLVGGGAALAASAPGRLARVMDGALMLPLGTSAVTLGFGFLLAFRSGPLTGRGGVALVAIAQALIAVPFVVRTLLPALRDIDDRLREAARTLGAPPVRVWREVDLPIVSRAGLVAAGFAFAVSMGEFGATVFVARASHPTIPVAIYRALTLPGPVNLGRAMALSVLLALITGLVVLAIDRLRLGAIGRF